MAKIIKVEATFPNETHAGVINFENTAEAIQILSEFFEKQASFRPTQINQTVRLEIYDEDLDIYLSARADLDAFIQEWHYGKLSTIEAGYGNIPTFYTPV